MRKTGAVVWVARIQKDYNIETPMWRFFVQSFADGQRLIVCGGSNTTAVASTRTLAKKSGMRCRQEPGYAPPLLVQAGGNLSSSSGILNPSITLNPETGAVFWTQPWPV